MQSAGYVEDLRGREKRRNSSLFERAEDYFLKRPAAAGVDPSCMTTYGHVGDEKMRERLSSYRRRGND